MFQTFSLMDMLRSLALVCISLPLLSSSPVPEAKPWENPCGGSASSNTILPQHLSVVESTTVRDDWEALDLLVILQKVALDDAKLFKSQVIARLDNSDMVRRLDDADIWQGFPKTGSFVYGTNTDLGQIFEVDFERYARLAIFIYTVKTELAMNEPGINREALDNLELTVSNILCKLDSEAHRRGVTVNYNLTRGNVLPADFSDINSRSHRDMRDYVTIRHTVIFMSSVTEGYQTQSSALQA